MLYGSIGRALRFLFIENDTIVQNGICVKWVHQALRSYYSNIIEY